MKYRIEQIGEVYYPQYRRWFVWKCFERAAGGSVCGVVYETIRFGSASGAMKYLNKVKHKILEWKM
jgi:hypothetical protein